MPVKSAPRTLEDFYSEYYRREKSADSPLDSRTRLVRTMSEYITHSTGVITVLDIGSGRRELEGAIMRNAGANPQSTLFKRLASTSLISFDIADIPPRRLIRNNGQHIRADSRAMPFKDESFDLVVSNHSIDMLRHEPGDFDVALAEVKRVTKIGGLVLLNYHPPELFTSLSEAYKNHDGILGEFFNGNPDRNPFYESHNEIVEDIVGAGLDIADVRKTVKWTLDGLSIEDAWWEVTALRAE